MGLHRLQVVGKVLTDLFAVSMYLFRVAAVLGAVYIVATSLCRR